MVDAKVIADLTAPQRRMILEIGQGQPREYSLGKTGFALVRMGLVFVNDLGARHLTDDGHSVHTLLKGTPNEQG